MNVREIIIAAKAGTLTIGREVDCDPHRPTMRKGARVAFCSVAWEPGCRITFREWLAMARQGTIINLYYDPIPGYNHGEWSTTATVEWDGQNACDYIKTDLLIAIPG